MDGAIGVLKPPGMTSHDVVAWLRRRIGERRIGHAGTLDPGAAGVLVICVGAATRLVDLLAESGKVYRAEVGFGRATDTLDAFGVETARSDAGDLTATAVAVACQEFQGVIAQVPPMVSAVKHQGRRLYELARSGITVERAARSVTVHRLELLSFRPGGEAVARLEVACGKGTYIRSLAADLGASLGLPAYLRHLVRTAVGPFSLAEAWTLEELADRPPAEFLISPARAVSHLPALQLSAASAHRLRHGAAPPLPPGWTSRPGPIALLGPEGDLLGLATYLTGTAGPGRLGSLKVLVNAEGKP